MSDLRFAFYVRAILEIARLEAGVVTEGSKKFVGDGLEIKHLEETTEREVHRAIDLVGKKDGDMSKSSRSKDNDEVVTLMRGVHIINDSKHQEAQPKKTNPNPKPLLRIRRTMGEEQNSSPLTKERSPFYGDIPSHPVTPAPDVALTSEIDEILDSCLDAAGYVEFLMLKLNEQDFLGEGSCALSEIVTKQSKSLTLKLQRSNTQGGRPGVKNLGTVTVHAEETVASRQAVELILRCSHLNNKDLFSKSDPFLRISRIIESGGSIPICKTEVINNNLSPTWRPVCLTMQQFGSKDNPLIIECFDFNSSGSHQLIGKIQSSVADLEKLHREKTGTHFHVASSLHKDSMKRLKGQLFVDNFSEKTLYSFLDYVSSGFELNFMVAVDFTASNGNPQSPDSLHYIDPSGLLNAYQKAIVEVGEVIQFYDSDKRFPAWGFGGRTMDGVVSHCFNLNGNASEFEVEGVSGIMSAYSNALRSVALAGPTLFGQVINKAANIASESLSYNSSKYFVLLIITDGVLTDLQETINSLVRASDLPLSILIVGVGKADFKQMEVLDADGGKRLESSTGRIATRDIVQFVPMDQVIAGQVPVVQALLEELPTQFLTYMRSRDINPLFVNEAQAIA
ncbi:hypothetical protein GIB67_034457 [Kingdonia uniflora]|uniref:C2 domain-containing protein n=1 Tax=Kingdonia uniflora TaxID=39325 RepID=A0A7J7PAW3_9MAGN|nr:hypothetical protein GIB67_034457 [Kingdonia uniflora]